MVRALSLYPSVSRTFCAYPSVSRTFCAHSGCVGVIADKNEVLKNFVEKDWNGLLFLVVARIDLFLLGRVLLPPCFGLTRLNTMQHTLADAGYEVMCKFLVEQVPYRPETESYVFVIRSLVRL